jgi:hypothetical protein
VRSRTGPAVPPGVNGSNATSFRSSGARRPSRVQPGPACSAAARSWHAAALRSKTGSARGRIHKTTSTSAANASALSHAVRRRGEARAMVA